MLESLPHPGVLRVCPFLDLRCLSLAARSVFLYCWPVGYRSPQSIP